MTTVHFTNDTPRDEVASEKTQKQLDASTCFTCLF